MKKMNGLLLIVAGCFHTLLGVIAGWSQLRAMVSYGVWNALGQQSQTQCLSSLSCMQWNALWWFIALGFMFIILGMVFYWIESRLQRCVPGVVGWGLFFVSFLGAVLVPASGFWFVMAVSINMIYCARIEQRKPV